MHFVEIIAYIFYLVFVFFLVYEKKYTALIFLIVAFVYAFLFEYINMTFTGTYAYILYGFGIADVPLYIPMIRSFLLYHASVVVTSFLNRTEKKNMQTRMVVWGVFLGSLYVLTYDLVIDVIAVKNNWWTRYLLPTQEWFGVAFGNFFGRFCVSFFFLLCFFLFRGNSLWKRCKTLFFALLFQTLCVIAPYYMFDCSPGDISQNTIYFFATMLVCILPLVGYFLFHAHRRSIVYSFSHTLLLYFLGCIHFGSLAYLVIMKYPFGLVQLSFAISLLYGFFVSKESSEQ